MTQPAKSERQTASRDRAHSTGVESTTQTSSNHTLVSRARAPINQFSVAATWRSRLLQPMRFRCKNVQIGVRENLPVRCWVSNAELGTLHALRSTTRQPCPLGIDHLAGRVPHREA